MILISIWDALMYGYLLLVIAIGITIGMMVSYYDVKGEERHEQKKKARRG